ncbi:uncharacterized protein LAJ45_04663 [Morchella importuna]|nr:uncharacterized protein LAJ45_04663 [Morchella importuna]KAH8151458.1 hypothetical protein LAJ45_04663 [Morchella importuna]
MLFESGKPPIDYPTSMPIWTWLFDSPASTLTTFPRSKVCSFVDSTTRKSLNYNTVAEFSTYASTVLSRHHGLQPGETVCFFSHNTIWYPVAMFAALRSGGVISGASPSYTEDEMTFALKTVNAKYIFTVPGSVEIAVAAAARAGIPKDKIFLLEGMRAGYKTLKELVEVGRREQTQMPAFDLGGRDSGEVCAYLSFSSGTTGLPKAVMISHRNMIAQLIQVASEKASDVDKLIAALPFFHIVGLAFSLHLPIVQNCDLVLMRAFTFPSFLATIETFRIPEVTLAPPILLRLTRDPSVRSYDLSCVRRWHTGAAPLSRDLIRELARRFPEAGIKHGYGLTENCGGVTVTPVTGYGYENAHTVGKLLRSTSVRIVGERGQDLGPYRQGEIWCKGPQVTMGYLNASDATKNTFMEDGWLRTGDLGCMDEEGTLTITGRIKDLVKVKGISVSPAEIEELLMDHSAVEECAVVGVPDAVSGEAPRAFVVLKEEARARGETSVDEVGRQLVRMVREKKYRPKWLRGGVVFLEELPRNPSGKILRRVLVAMGDLAVVVEPEAQFEEERKGSGNELDRKNSMRAGWFGQEKAKL